VAELINYDARYRGQEIFITGTPGHFRAFVNNWRAPDAFATVRLAEKDAEAFIDAMLGWEGVEPDHYLLEDDE
jgi:hypothetical protein